VCWGESRAREQSAYGYRFFPNQLYALNYIHTSLRCCIVRYGVPVEPSRGPIGTQWPPISQCGEAWIQLAFPSPSIIVNRLSSRLVVMTGAQSGSRIVFLFGDACEPHSSDERSPQKSPPGLFRLCRVCGALANRKTPRVPSDPHSAPFIDVLENQSRSAKEALELTPTATAR